jgi:hypothetical protein
MVRSAEQVNTIKMVLPNVNLAIGDLDNAEFLIEQASRADIVISKPSDDALHVHVQHIRPQTQINRWVLTTLITI